MLKLGISVFDFWDMTPDEMYKYTQAKQDVLLQEHKDRLVLNYNLATMVASFVNISLNGKHMPDISEVYPSVFNEQDVSDAQMEAYKQQFMAFAVLHNNNRAQKGELE